MVPAPTIIPSWTGKALGAAAAFVYAPASPSALFWWLVVCVALGHGLDRLTRQLGTPDPTASHDPEPPAHGNAEDAALRFTFAALGRIAAAADQPSATHRAAAERLLGRLHLDPTERRDALVWFYAGGEADYPFESLAGPCRQQFAANPALRELAQQHWCRLTALIDTPAATVQLLGLGDLLGWDRRQLAGRAVAAAALLPDEPRLQQARDTLGVDRRASASAIRMAYRRGVAQCHPDRLPAGASAADRAAADERMWRLREALELLSRG